MTDNNGPRPAAEASPSGSVLPARVATPRLILRRWSHDEAGVLAAAVTSSLDHLRPWMAWVKFEPLTLAERVQLIEGWTRGWEDGGDVVYGVFLDGEAIGGSGLHRRTAPRSLEIGYWIHVDHVRHGYATELTAALTTTAFGLEGIDVVHCRTDEANEASAGVPAKLGFSRTRIIEREPEAPGETGRLIDWTMTAKDWRALARTDRAPPNLHPGACVTTSDIGRRGS